MRGRRYIHDLEVDTMGPLPATVPEIDEVLTVGR